MLVTLAMVALTTPAARVQRVRPQFFGRHATEWVNGPQARLGHMDHRRGSYRLRVTQVPVLVRSRR